MEREELNNSTIIRNISKDQSQILYNIMSLYNDGKPFDCDMTASTLAFYRKTKGDKYEIPMPRMLFDVYPMNEELRSKGLDFPTIGKITPFQRLPLEDCSIHSIVVDLPFVVSPKTCKSVVEKKEGANVISNRFSSWYPATEFYENAYWWLNECYRVLDDDGICVWKMQDTVSGGINHSFLEYSFICATDAGFYTVDEFILEANNRLISASRYNQQKHARKYTSAFYVFQATKAKNRNGKTYGDKVNCLKLLENCKKNVYEGKIIEMGDDVLDNTTGTAEINACGDMACNNESAQEANSLQPVGSSQEVVNL